MRWRVGWGRRWRGVLVLATLVLGLALGTGVGLAHSNLDHSDPAEGATLSRSPAQLRLWFTEDLEPHFSRVVVYDQAGRPVSAGSQVAPDDPRLLLVALAPNLPAGWYVAVWQAQAKIDGHLTSGSVTFGVGVSGPEPHIAAAARAATSGTGSPLDVGLRWLILLATIAMVGSFAFWLLQGSGAGAGAPEGPGGGPAGAPRPNPFRPLAVTGRSRADVAAGPVSRSARWPRARISGGQWALAELAWMLYLLANVVFLTDVVAAVTQASSLDDLGPPLVELATQTSYGQLWLLRMALGGVLGILLLARGNGCPSWVDGPALAVGGALLLGFSLASHSAAVNRLAPIAVANDWLHFAAVTIWIGGLLQLAVVFARPAKVPRTLGGVDPRWALLRRFGALATYALALVVITGLAEAGFHVGTLANLVGTPYGRVVALKTLLLLPLLALAAVQQGVIRSVLADQPLPALASRLLGDRRPPTWISRALLLETFWAALLLAAVGLLTSLSPP